MDQVISSFRPTTGDGFSLFLLTPPNLGGNVDKKRYKWKTPWVNTCSALTCRRFLLFAVVDWCRSFVTMMMWCSWFSWRCCSSSVHVMNVRHHPWPISKISTTGLLGLSKCFKYPRGFFGPINKAVKVVSSLLPVDWKSSWGLSRISTTPIFYRRRLSTHTQYIITNPNCFLILPS